MSHQRIGILPSEPAPDRAAELKRRQQAALKHQLEQQIAQRKLQEKQEKERADSDNPITRASSSSLTHPPSSTDFQRQYHSVQERQAELTSRLNQSPRPSAHPSSSSSSSTAGARNLARQYAADLSTMLAPPSLREPYHGSAREDSPPKLNFDRLKLKEDYSQPPSKSDYISQQHDRHEHDSGIQRRNGMAPNYWNLERNLEPPPPASHPPQESDRGRRFDNERGRRDEDDYDRHRDRDRDHRDERPREYERERRSDPRERESDSRRPPPPSNRDYDQGRDYNRDHDRRYSRDQRPPADDDFERTRLADPPRRRDDSPPQHHRSRDYDDDRNHSSHPSSHRRDEPPTSHRPPPSSHLQPQSSSQPPQQQLQSPSFARPSHKHWTASSGAFLNPAQAREKEAQEERKRQQYREELKRQADEQRERREREKAEEKAQKEKELKEYQAQLEAEQQAKKSPATIEKEALGGLIHNVVHAKREEHHQDGGEDFRVQHAVPSQPASPTQHSQQEIETNRRRFQQKNYQEDYDQPERSRDTHRETNSHSNPPVKLQPPRINPRRGSHTRYSSDEDQPSDYQLELLRNPMHPKSRTRVDSNPPPPLREEDYHQAPSSRSGPVSQRDGPRSDRSSAYQDDRRSRRDENSPNDERDHPQPRSSPLTAAVNELRHTDLTSHPTPEHPGSVAPIVPILRATVRRSHLDEGSLVPKSDRDLVGVVRQIESNEELRQNLDYQSREVSERRARQVAQQRLEEEEEERRKQHEREELYTAFLRDREEEEATEPPPPSNPFPGQEDSHGRSRDQVMREHERVGREQKQKLAAVHHQEVYQPNGVGRFRPEVYDPANYTQSDDSAVMDTPYERRAVVESPRLAVSHRSQHHQQQQQASSRRRVPNTLTESTRNLLELEADAQKRIAKLHALEKERLASLARRDAGGSSASVSYRSHQPSQLQSPRSISSSGAPPSPIRHSSSSSYLRSPPRSPGISGRLGGSGGSFDMGVKGLPTLPLPDWSIPRKSPKAHSQLEQSLHGSSDFHVVPEPITYRPGFQRVKEDGEDDELNGQLDAPSGILDEKSLFIAPDGSTSHVPLPFEDPLYDVNASVRGLPPQMKFQPTASYRAPATLTAAGGVLSPQHRTPPANLFSTTFALPSTGASHASNLRSATPISPSAILKAAGSPKATRAATSGSHETDYSDSFVDGSVDLDAN